MPEKYGNQKPRIEVVPKYEYTDGQDASELVKAYGYELDPWQKTVISAWLGRDSQDKFTSKSCGLAVPRQNGKNALLEVRELYGMVCMGEHILHTAHEVKTARKAFNRLCSFFENEREYPELAAMVASIRKTNGQEAIELWKLDPDTLEPMVGKLGGSVEFSARSRGAARGFTADTVVFDEAQELTDEQLEALMPTLSAAPSGNRQYIYTGTPPSPTSPGDVFARVRQSAKTGETDELAWHEWSVESLPRRDTPTEKLIELAYKTNPAMGFRIDKKAVMQEALTMAVDGFARERLGWWSELAAQTRAISEALWTKTAIDAIGNTYKSKKCFGVKFTPDGLNYALVGVKSDGHGKYAVELIEHANTAAGLDALAEWLLARKNNACMVVLDGAGQADVLINALKNAPRGYVYRASTGCAIAATSGFIDALKAGKCVHTHAKELDRAAEVCARRQIGAKGGWGFAGENSEILEACALALWACKNTKRNPKRKQRLQ